MDNLNKIAKVIKKSKSIAIFTHISPDFDALSSSVAISLALKKLGKISQVFINEELTYDEKKLFDKYEICYDDCNQSEYDLFIALDLSDIKRLGRYSDVFSKQDNTIVLDHHLCIKNIAKYNFIDTSRSSCSEIVYDTIKKLKIDIDSEIATFIYAGLSSDCGSFRNTNTNSCTFKTALELYNLGADINKVNQILYDSSTLKDIEFEKYLLNNFEIENDFAYCIMDLKTLKKMNGTNSDCQHFSRKLLSIENVNRSFSLVESEKGVYKLSLRAKSGFDVRKVAIKFGGGGHIPAAGATIYGKNIAEVKKKVLDAMNNWSDNGC